MLAPRLFVLLRAMNVLVLSKYDRLAASTRLRFMQYQDALAESDIHLTLSPLFDDAYLKEKFHKGRTSKRLVIKAFLRRLNALRSVRRFDLIMVAYELFPYAPALFEQLLGWLRVPYIVDFDDAIFHMYDEHPKAPIRALLGNKIGLVMRNAACVITGNSYLQSYAQRWNDNVKVIPTVIDLKHYQRADPSQPKGGYDLTLGWIGSPSTTEHLATASGALARFGAQRKVRAIVIGASKIDFQNIDVDQRAWTKETEISDLCESDVGLMPLPNLPFARGKCGFKLIQYMGCALPVIASPIGANRDIVAPGENGFWAEDDDAWVEALHKLADDAALRKKMGDAGYRIAEARFSLASQAPRMVRCVQDTLGRGR